MESIDHELLRASFQPTDAGRALLEESLHSTVLRHRVLAVRGLVRLHLMTLEQWRRVLRDPDPAVRRDALEQLAHAPLEDVGIFETVIELLEDSDALVVDAAAFALGEHAHAGGVERLCVVAKDHDDARCRESAIASLGAIGDDRAREVILNALHDKAPIRRRAIVALANFEGPDIDAALESASEDRDWQVRSAVTQLRDDD
ncbi:MAG: HEAT repeat domain-containing protein [Acidimicrobiales bacterium]